MTPQSTLRLAISIDFKQNRIRIYRKTLHAIGDPDYIQLLVNPENNTLAIQRSDRSDLLAHRVPWARLADGGSCELHSTPLTRRLLGLCGDWQGNRTYRIYGKIIPSEGIAEFRVVEPVRV